MAERLAARWAGKILPAVGLVLPLEILGFRITWRYA
jgi:hypothetical protein